MTRQLFGYACVALLCLSPHFSSDAEAQTQEYFWPDHQPAVNFKMKSHSMRGTLTLNAGKTVKIGDHAYRELTAVPKRVIVQHEVEYLRGDQHGLYVRYSASTDSPETQLLKLPAKPGDSWETVDADGKPVTRTIQEIGNCKVRGKEFERCITVAFESRDFAAIAVFAPQFGEVVNSQVNGFIFRELITK